VLDRRDVRFSYPSGEWRNAGPVIEHRLVAVAGRTRERQRLPLATP
jgi:hypothetical protein